MKQHGVGQWKFLPNVKILYVKPRRWLRVCSITTTSFFPVRVSLCVLVCNMLQMFSNILLFDGTGNPQLSWSTLDWTNLGTQTQARTWTYQSMQMGSLMSPDCLKVGPWIIYCWHIGALKQKYMDLNDLNSVGNHLVSVPCCIRISLTVDYLGKPHIDVLLTVLDSKVFLRNMPRKLGYVYVSDANIDYKHNSFSLLLSFFMISVGFWIKYNLSTQAQCWSDQNQ